MNRLPRYLRKAARLCCLAALLFGLVVATGRLWVWVSSDVEADALRAAPEVFIWDAPDGFNGYSALITSEDGTDFIAGSDRQHYITGQFTRGPEGQITGLNKITRWPVLLGNLTQVTRFQGDLEGLTRLSDGRIGMAFENYARLQIMDAPGAVPKGLHRWDVFEDVFGNELFEAIATLPGDRLLALFQHGPTRGQTPAYLYENGVLGDPAPFPVTPGFDISGAELGPDGCLYVLERRYGLFTGFQNQLIRMAPEPPWQGTRALLFRSKPMSLGNGEGVAVWRREDGLVATIITDDGFPPFSPTRFIELPLKAHQGCADQ